VREHLERDRPVRDRGEHLACEAAVIADSRLAHQRWIRRKALDVRLAIQLEHARQIRAVCENLDGQSIDGCHRRSLRVAANAAVDSHLVCAAFTAGCDTSRCQTTAWNASACAVMVSGLTVGTITHASAT